MAAHPKRQYSPIPVSGADGGWTLVVSRRNGNKKTKKELQTSTSEQQQQPLPWTPSDPSSAEPATVAKLLDKVHRSIAKLKASNFFLRFLFQLRHHPTVQSHLFRWSHLPIDSDSAAAAQMVVYGIGSIDTYEPPRLQLALSILLHKELGFHPPIQIFDPVLSAEECTAMEKLGCKVLSVDERARREVSAPTLFYMPHCEARMYDNLLAANWSPATLNRMVVLGNSFGEYESYVTGMGKGSRVEGEAKYVVKASRFANEISINEGKSAEEEVVAAEEDEVLAKAFNLTSWHFFSLEENANGYLFAENGRIGSV